MKATALYIHIPFCDHKCVYCDFYSIITTTGVSAYYNALIAEMEYRARVFSGGRVYNSIYFGGGTPSLMPPEYLGGIITRARELFSVAPNAEITMETNPGTVNPARLRAFKAAGINRVSIGIQSFHADELAFMTRIHDAETAEATVFAARDAGFTNISVDLIFNLPGQSRDKWLSNLNRALTLPITHISPYSLILERGTILNKMVLDGKVTLQDDDHDADLYEHTIATLNDRGFRQYEVSNFALPGYECLHNHYYWQYKEYLALGTSAHAFMQGRRWWNYSSLTFYLAAVKEKGYAEAGGEVLTKEQMKQEYIMLALRGSGLTVDNLVEMFRTPLSPADEQLLLQLQQQGKTLRQEGTWRLTPAGYAVCDEILARLSGS